jgi:hypothetical protein
MTKRSDLTTLKQLDIVAFNQSAEAYFQTVLKELILADGGRTSYLGAVQEIAYRLNVSPETAKRYILKHTARSAPFEVSDGLISQRKRASSGRKKRTT